MQIADIRVYDKDKKQVHFIKLCDLLNIPDVLIMRPLNKKDIKGQWIYEGDIVTHRIFDKPSDKIAYGSHAMQHTGAKPKYVVQWSNFGYVPFSFFHESTFNDLEWEVVGNIYNE